MKTTIDIEAPLLEEAKRRAAREGKTLKEWVEDALRARMLPAGDDERGFRLELPVVEGRRAPAVDVSDRRALYDFLDEHS